MLLIHLQTNGVRQAIESLGSPLISPNAQRNSTLSISIKLSTSGFCSMLGNVLDSPTFW